MGTISKKALIKSGPLDDRHDFTKCRPVISFMNGFLTYDEHLTLPDAACLEIKNSIYEIFLKSCVFYAEKRGFQEANIQYIKSFWIHAIKMS
jgi:hypothetical protein